MRFPMLDEEAYEEQRLSRTGGDEPGACPECDEGWVVATGWMDWETGCTPVHCDRCGYYE